MADQTPRIGLFVTCLVDLFRPSVGFAALRLLRAAGCEVDVPRNQTCCGQPAYNSGARATATEIARRFVLAFDGFDYVVAPSGSCAAMIRLHYPRLLADDPVMAERAGRLAERCFELVTFLVEERGMIAPPGDTGGVATYHDACSGLRELGIREQPRRLLAAMDGMELRESPDSDLCCGFGGTFCVKYPDISTRLADDKLRAIADTGADLLTAGDLGCLFHLAGRLKRQASPIAVRHVAELLAGMTDAPPIAESPENQGLPNGTTR